MTDLPDDFQTAHLAEVDPEIARVLDRELGRQQGTLEMIASENFVPQAVLEPGDRIMGMALDHGGHLTHGMKLNVSGKLYEVIAYHVRREDLICDMDEVEKLAKEHKPKVIVAGWSAYPRQLDFAAFREIADSVGAKLMVDMAHFAGLVAAGEHPNPVEHADVVTTTIHKTLCGPRSGMIL